MPKLIMSEIDTGLSTELNVETKVEETPETTPKEKVEEKPQETIEALESLAEKSDDNIPLKKYMAEKNARRDAESKAKQFEAEITKLRENPYKSNEDIKLDVKSLSEKHNIDEEVLKDILNASYTLTKDKVKEELEKEINPKLAELDRIKQEKAHSDFNSKFDALYNQSLVEMPEYANLVDKDDLKQWVRSGQYSKLSLPQLIEQKYSKFVATKKPMETSHASKQIEIPSAENMTDEDWVNINKNPELKKKWKSTLEDRLRKYM